MGRARTRWINYIRDLAWNRWGLHSSKMMDAIEDREVWQLNLELLPRNPHGKACNEERIRAVSSFKLSSVVLSISNPRVVPSHFSAKLDKT